MASEFKQFLLRGNVVDLAVGVVIGAAFGAVVKSLVEDLLTPLIGAVVGAPDFSALQFTLNGSVFGVGAFLNAVFFLVVKSVNALVSRARTAPPADPTTKKCPECLSEVPVAARRCAHCAIVLAAA